MFSLVPIFSPSLQTIFLHKSLVAWSATLPYNWWGRACLSTLKVFTLPNRCLHLLNKAKQTAESESTPFAQGLSLRYLTFRRKLHLWYPWI